MIIWYDMNRLDLDCIYNGYGFIWYDMNRLDCIYNGYGFIWYDMNRLDLDCIYNGYGFISSNYTSLLLRQYLDKEIIYPLNT